MQHVVDSYRCEWKEAVDDPNRRKRFRSFVNSDEPGRARIVQVVEREQLIPARELAVEEV
jgi:nitrite reductase (NADH) large subunit